VLGSVDPVNKTIKNIQAFITFEAEHTTGRCSITWVQDVDDWDKWKVFMTYTVLDESKGHPFLKGENRPLFADPYHKDGKKNWKDYREETEEFKVQEPSVLIVGR